MTKIDGDEEKVVADLLIRSDKVVNKIEVCISMPLSSTVTYFGKAIPNADKSVMNTEVGMDDVSTGRLTPSIGKLSIHASPFHPSVTQKACGIEEHSVKRTSSINLKKPSLPIFSGERADWPEFKCVWKAMAESEYSSKMQLAMEFKLCCF